MNENLITIINHFGINNQQRKLQEEVFELQEAITLFESGNGDIKNIIEELGDTIFILRQLQSYYEITAEELHEVIEYKRKRTIDRIESGYYKKGE